MEETGLESLRSATQLWSLTLINIQIYMLCCLKLLLFPIAAVDRNGFGKPGAWTPL